MALEASALPSSARPGTEIAALAPFNQAWTWTGTIEPGGMGPASPLKTGASRGRTVTLHRTGCGTSATSSRTNT